MNVWHLLAVHVPNLLPRTVFGLHLPWLRKAARLIYSIVLFTIGLLAAGYVIRKPKKSSEPATWAQVVIGAMFVWFMFALGYGVIPHEWLTFGNSYLNFDSSSYLVHRSQIVNNLPPFDITRDKVVDAVAALIYVIVLGLNIYFFAAWQKRKVAEPADGGGDDRDRSSTDHRRRRVLPLPSREAHLRVRPPSDDDGLVVMARNDANPPMPEFSTSYVLQEVDPKWLTQAVKPKQFLHIDQAECILCEGCVDICPWKCIHMLSTTAIDEAVNADQPGDDPKDHVFFVVDEDVCTRCALCVDRCPTGVIVLGKVTDQWRDGDPNTRTNRHGYAYGVRF